MAGHTERELLEIAASLEARSTHPLANAVLDYAKRQGVEVQPAEDFQTIPGKGASGRTSGGAHLVGSHRYLEERGQETPEVHERLEPLAHAGTSVVVVGNDRHVCGYIALADEGRPESVAAFPALHAGGIRHVAMLTGDNRRTAGAIAKETSVDHYWAELLPGDKVEAVEGLVREFGSVAIVGDGVNDAPAMARATIGIAMGAVGSDAAIETADIALMSDDLGKLPWHIRHARRTLAVVQHHITFSP